MSIDYSTNTYTKIGSFTNVMNEVPNHKVRTENNEAFLYGTLHDLVYDMTLRHPEWTIVGEDSYFSSDSNKYVVKRVRIYDGSDQIGHVCIDTWRESKFEIRNPRINRAMERRNYKSTKDPKKALKIIESFFSPKTLDERVEEARNAVGSAVQTKSWTMRREFNAIWERLTPALTTYISLNLNTIRPALEAYGAGPATLDELIPKVEERKSIHSLENARTKNAGTTVLLHGDRYIVLRDNDRSNVEMLAASQLTEDMRTKLGVLKVVADDDVIESIGMRINSTTFYLLP